MRIITYSVLFCYLFLIQCNTMSQKGHHKHTNNLIHESSPYLLQHAHNPVDWYPWGEEALTKAQEEDKLLLISIGYAACHWCHVMEHESFENDTVAEMMNEHFINIKVDREERPDIDDVYMTACQMASGRGCGWPLNAFALPDGKPIWAGTYFPPKEWMSVLQQFVELKSNDPDKLRSYAERLTQGIRGSEFQPPTPNSEFSRDTLQQIASRFMLEVDGMSGGRAGAPKFPMPNNWDFLMHYAALAKDPQATRALQVTLDNMANGGIYDQVGGGFARYSVDAKWHVPHFEKMLYDNGQLVSLYAHAYQFMEIPMYERIVRETIEFVERELTDSTGGFYSSLDADSEGEEGKFYTWTIDEVEMALNNEADFELAKDYFDITAQGNWEHGKNILQITKTDQAVAVKHGISAESLRERIENIKERLLEVRASRIRPGLDDKILCSWNALMLKGFVDAYRALGDEAYLQAALTNARFIEDNMWREDGGLNRNYKEGKSSINAFLDDYANLMEAWIALYQVTFDEQWLTKSAKLADYAFEHFFDEQTGMFFYTSDLDPPLVARKKEIGDNVIPASNSIMAKALHKLGLFLYNQDYLEVSKLMLAKMAPTLRAAQQPSFYSNWCDLYIDHVWPLYEVAIVGKDHTSLNEDMMREYLPNAIFLGGSNEGSLELLQNKLQEGETYIYVCQDKACKYPVKDKDAALDLMQPIL